MIPRQPRADEAFWRRKRLEDLSDAEWEQICDGCGRCCLHKVEDAGSGRVYFTDLACHLFDTVTCRCSDYAHRLDRVPTCWRITPALARRLRWLPHSCAYRRLARGEDLPAWHPLVSGTADSIHTAGVSVRGLTTPWHRPSVRRLKRHVRWDGEWHEVKGRRR